MSIESEKTPSATLCLTVGSDLFPTFYRLLGQGFSVTAKLECTIEQLLCRQLGVSPEYLDQRIQTIFLDGKAVDDVNAAIVRQGSTLALSAAMPGLAGATLRRGGVYAPMRRQISHNKTPMRDQDKEGRILIKLFNLVARELGPAFLKHGIWVSGKNLYEFFRNVPDNFANGCRAAAIDGQPIDPRKLMSIEWERQYLFIKLIIEESC